MCETHEYQRGVQIVVIFLHEFPVVLFSLLLVVFVEPDAKMLLP